MLMRQCFMCGALVEQGKRCPHCAKDYQKQYDLRKRNKARNAFYHSAAWKRVSDAVKIRACGLDEFERSRGRLVAGDTVHHIEPLSERPELGLSMQNLIYVSSATHQRVHAEYDKGEREGAAMKVRLKECIPPFGKLFV